MIYFAELKGKPVVTEDGIKVGTLDDFIFLAAEKPILTKLIVRNVFGHRLIIPIDYLKKINQELRIEKKYQSSVLTVNELYLVKNLLDKQIIDLKGNKVVRVNDVVIQDKDGFYIAGVDVGVLGILRWFNVENLISHLLRLFNIKISSQFLSWSDIQPLELVRGQVKLKKQEEKLKKIKPEDLADYLEQTNVANAEKILRILDQKQAAEVINNLNLNYQAALFKNYHPDKAALILGLIEPDEACDILLTLSKKRRQQFINYLPKEKKQEIEYLINLSQTPIGDLLTTEYLTVEADNIVKEVIDKIKKETVDFYSLDYVYVVNKEGQLIGVFSLHELLLQPLEMPIYKFMTQNVVVTHMTTPKGIVIKRLLKYKLQALPVIDRNKKILGIVTFDDLMSENEKLID